MMTAQPLEVLVLAANGQVARHAAKRFLQSAEVQLTLHLRRAGCLNNPDPARC